MMTDEQVTDDPEVVALRAAHGDRYFISRVGALWMATLRQDDGTEPTLVRDTAEELEAAMANPRLWGGRLPGPRRPL
ncbi:hypothetical protein [Nocardiopsis eucommiae]|uniref:hypothetical protein n=1 Tax=Nocardiopsis eucommiae TaxID=2831970 RepID=UPI003D742EED